MNCHSWNTCKASVMWFMLCVFSLLLVVYIIEHVPEPVVVAGGGLLCPICQKPYKNKNTLRADTNRLHKGINFNNLILSNQISIKVYNKI